MSLRLAIAGLIAIVGASPAIGATKARPAPIAKLAAAVNLENKRLVSLLSFEIVMPAKDKAPETIVGKLDKPLAAGASVSFPLSGARGCLFEARWKFEDANDSGAVDLCNDAHIVLVD
jgi:hypothetical protein